MDEPPSMAPPPPPSDGLRALLSQKEQELRDAYHLNVASLEHSLLQKDLLIQDLQTTFLALQDDFIYNLNLLDDRDKELLRLDNAEEQYKTQLHDRDARISQLKMLIADKTSEVSNLRALLQAHELHEIELTGKLRREHQLALQHHEDVQRASLDKAENEKTELLMQLRAVAQNSDLLKQSHATDIDRIKRDHELDLRLLKQDADQGLLDAEHRLATALGELSAANLGKAALEDKLQLQLDHNRNLDQKLRQVQWETADLVKSHAIRIAALDENLKQVQAKRQDEKQIYEEQLSRYHLEWDSRQKTLEHEKADLAERLSHVTAKLNDAIAQNTSTTSHSHATITALKVTNQEQTDRIRALDDTVATLRHEQKDAESSYQHQLSRRDSDLHHLQERLSRVEAENIELHQHLNTYKHEISKRMDAENVLNRNILEQNMEWERRYDGLMKKRHWDEQDFIRSLVAAKDRAEADLQLLRTRLDRGDGNGPVEEADNSIQAENQMLKSRVDELMAQNEQLATIVHQMKDDMQTLYQNNATTSHKSLDQEMAPLQKLLAQKQDLIDQLLDAQTRLHQRTKASLLASLDSKPLPWPSNVDASLAMPGVNRSLESLQHENAQLRAQLRSTAADLKKLAVERIKLMDMSNALRAELRLRLHESDDEALVPPGLQAQVVKRQSRPAIKVRPVGSNTNINTKPVVVVSATNDPITSMTGTTNMTNAKPSVVVGSAPPMTTRPRRRKEDSADPAEKEAARKVELRAKGIRNWNEKDDT
ncbi:hypothetical protein SeMB42_g00035 [Synchytrium endobioticum]|uniref:Uncharacterized protein n=1 Tax=Synchytrium endobioticum TaxID=286115 RepID=A0A507DAG9_9FUNG|nr:hypothetical protein SeLEV6574_g02042 [Synchytrium endobioticum]TPX55045.1 hypothetical protein SeMB42_g00035 [Synchytrium endobioticum]